MPCYLYSSHALLHNESDTPSSQAQRSIGIETMSANCLNTNSSHKTATELYRSALLFFGLPIPFWYSHRKTNRKHLFTTLLGVPMLYKHGGREGGVCCVCLLSTFLTSMSQYGLLVHSTSPIQMSISHLGKKHTCTS